MQEVEKSFTNLLLIFPPVTALFVRKKEASFHKQSLCIIHPPRADAKPRELRRQILQAGSSLKVHGTNQSILLAFPSVIIKPYLFCHLKGREYFQPSPPFSLFLMTLGIGRWSKNSLKRKCSQLSL